MPDETDIIISELTNAPQIDDTAVFPLTQDNGGSPATFKASMSAIAGKTAEGTTFVNLETTAKNLVGAINEVAQGGGGSADIISEASGSIATFNDGGDNIPVKSLVTEITATQAGTGTPSPSNPRAISGFDSVVITNKDDLDNPTTTDTHTITLPETIYGGNAELVGGNGTKTFDISDLGDLSWSYDSTNQRFVALLTGAKLNGSSRAYTNPNSKCTNYEVIFTDREYTYNEMISDISSKNNVIWLYTANGQSYVNVKDTAYTDAPTFKTAMAGVKFMYELETPTAFTFTPESIPTLSGVNNIYSNCGDVAVKYFNENADQMAELIKAMTR